LLFITDFCYLNESATSVLHWPLSSIGSGRLLDCNRGSIFSIIEVFITVLFVF
jgi:hypothetical protein